MTIRTILLYLSDSARNETCIDAAAELAVDHGAQVAALYRTSSTYFPFAAASDFAGYVPPEVIDKMIAEERATEEAVKRLFLDRCKRADTAAEWRGSIRALTKTLNASGRCADLLVVGQTDPQEVSPAADWPYELLLAAGRPIFIIPYVGDFPHFGKRILLAWNGSREATRAAHDALPFLKKAETVTVFSASPHEGQHALSADIAAHLGRHGVNATTANTTADDAAIGDVLLSAVADHGADMLVMGAWGHSRLRELVFGGATRHVLRTMTVPVLMSH